MNEVGDNIYFEFQLHTLELSSEITLQFTDFTVSDEKGYAIALWENEIDELKRCS